MEAKTEVILVYVSKSDKQKIEQKAEDAGMAVSVYMRWKALKEDK